MSINSDLINCIRLYLNNSTKEYEDSDDRGQLLKLAIDQSLQTILYPVYKVKSFKSYYISWVIKQEELLCIQSLITKLFNDNNIKHIFFKGAVICKLYDDPSIRTRGDIDLYINYKNINVAKNILMNNNFILDSSAESEHHLSFKYKNVEVELHFNMFDENVSKAWLKYFKNPFSLTNDNIDFLYKFNDTSHFLYCICHFANHLRSGAGLRYILDFYYMMLKTNIDYDEVHKYIKVLKIDILYNNILNAIYYITDKEFDSNMKKVDISFFIEYLLSHGIHGQANNNETSMQASKNHKFRYFFSRILIINTAYRNAQHPILGKHWFLYPICLISHWWYLITHKSSGFFKFIFGKNKNKSLYKKLGI